MQRLIQAAATAIHRAHEGVLGQDIDPAVESALTELVESIQALDGLAWDEAISTQGEDFAQLECLLSKTSSRVMCQLLALMPSELRCISLHQTLFNAMEKMGPLAYSMEGNMRFMTDLKQAQATIPLLKPYSRVEGHYSSALRVQQFGFG